MLWRQSSSPGNQGSPSCLRVEGSLQSFRRGKLELPSQNPLFCGSLIQGSTSAYNTLFPYKQCGPFRCLISGKTPVSMHTKLHCSASRRLSRSTGDFSPGRNSTGNLVWFSTGLMPRTMVNKLFFLVYGTESPHRLTGTGSSVCGLASQSWWFTITQWRSS